MPACVSYTFPTFDVLKQPFLCSMLKITCVSYSFPTFDVLKQPFLCSMLKITHTTVTADRYFHALYNTYQQTTTQVGESFMPCLGS
mmetsp:Transcript_760/g.2138  ORF Transcript_760/g.2138 Transcript_760/m.2138 type:complete len:86 (+) Transcript_760:1078-1335(+)